MIRRTLYILFISVSYLQAQTKQPNVVLILTDDQGYGDMSCHGNPILKTPEIDKLHADAIRLTDFHVNSFCTPSRASLMTGRISSRTGAWRTASGRTMLHTDEITMAQVFKDNGYATGLFGKWHLGGSYPHRPQDRGFAKVLWHKCGGITQISDYWGNDYFDDFYEEDGEYKQFKGYCTDIWFEQAAKFMKKSADADKPFFCYIPTNAPHTPFIVDEKYSRPYERDDVNNSKFYGMIANLDENVGKLRRQLDEWKLTENTIFIYMTDNGSAAGSKMTSNPDGLPLKGFNAGMRGKKASIYDGGHRVPCFIYWPAGNLVGGKDIDQLTAHYDLLPTLAELCDLEKVKTKKLDGKSIVPLLKGEEWPARTMVRQYQGGVFFRYAPQPWTETVVMTERWRLIDGKELYEIDKDPAQQKDIAEKHPQVVDQLRKEYSKFWYDVEARLLKPVPNHIGNPAENPLMLTSQDWYIEPFGNAGVKHGNVHKLNGVVAPWLVEVEQAGSYEITLRQFPEEANLPLSGINASIRIADVHQQKEISQGANFITFTAFLPSGPARLVTEFTDKAGKKTSAYYCYVKLLNE
jgi:arylsulfatase A-like enzyme